MAIYHQHCHNDGQYDRVVVLYFHYDLQSDFHQFSQIFQPRGVSPRDRKEKPLIGDLHYVEESVDGGDDVDDGDDVDGGDDDGRVCDGK